MNVYASRSRITKALTDANLESSFPAAEARLDAVLPCVVLDAGQALTAAGQAAVLTAIITARKCFGRVLLVSDRLDVPLLQPLPVGKTIGEAAAAFGADVSASIEGGVTHRIGVGVPAPWHGWTVTTWWDRWLSGTRTYGEPSGSCSLALSGMFSGALAVRQLFANVLRTAPAQEATVSLWEPMIPATRERRGPKGCTIPTRLWLAGLGHLGQAMVWGLVLLPLEGERLAVLQDDQWIEDENEPTSMLVTRADTGARPRKVRLAAQWLDHAGWTTELIERRHRGDIHRTDHDPQILISGLDDVKPRRLLAAHGFDYMLDAGIGRGAVDFEGIQVRTIPAGSSIEGLWLDSPDETRRDRLMTREAYYALEQDIGRCGVVPLADASVSVPFVGAATAALVLAQLSRLGAMQPAATLLQMELSAPELVIDGGSTHLPSSFLGGETFIVD